MNVHAIPKTIDTAQEHSERPTREEVEAAYRAILRYAGGDPNRDGLLQTPARAVRAHEEHFTEYGLDPSEILDKPFTEIDGYDELVVLPAIPFESHCEHHLAPIIGKAWVAYLPDKRVVGISKLARTVDAFAKRLQMQERMTSQIANVIDKVLRPQGVGVVIKAMHHCMSARGVYKHGTDMVTSRMLGLLKSDRGLRQEFLSLVD